MSVQFAQSLISFFPVTPSLIGLSQFTSLTFSIFFPSLSSSPLFLLLSSLSLSVPCLFPSVVFSRVLRRAEVLSRQNWPWASTPPLPSGWDSFSAPPPPPSPPRSAFIPRSVPPSSSDKPPLRKLGKIWQTHQEARETPKWRTPPPYNLSAAEQPTPMGVCPWSSLSSCYCKLFMCTGDFARIILY